MLHFLLIARSNFYISWGTFVVIQPLYHYFIYKYYLNTTRRVHVAKVRRQVVEEAAERGEDVSAVSREVLKQVTHGVRRTGDEVADGGHGVHHLPARRHRPIGSRPPSCGLSAKDAREGFYRLGQPGGGVPDGFNDAVQWPSGRGEQLCEAASSYSFLVEVIGFKKGMYPITKGVPVYFITGFHFASSRFSGENITLLYSRGQVATLHK